MADQLLKKEAPTNSKTNNNSSSEFEKQTYKWTTKQEKCLLLNMIGLKPSGINKHLSMLFIRENMSKQINFELPSKTIWRHLNTKWDISAADEIEGAPFEAKVEPYVLPEEYMKLAEEKIKKMKEEESLLAEIKKEDISINLDKISSKSNDMSFDSKDNRKETAPLILSQRFSIKTSQVELEEIPSTRRSLRTNDKPEEKDQKDSPNKKQKLKHSYKSDEVNKSKDVKQFVKKPLNQSKDLDKNKKVPSVRGRKRKMRNISESSFSSDNSKQRLSLRHNDIPIDDGSDSSSRSVTPELPRSKTINNRSVTPEISGKSKLRSSDKDLKNKPSMEKAILKSGQKVNLIIPELKIQRLKPDHVAAMMEPSLIQNKNEVNNKARSKVRNRVTSDLLVVQQSSDLQTLGRRSCSNKSSQ